MAGHTMRDALAAEGFELVVYDKPTEHPDALGDRECCVVSMLLTGNRIALWDESWMPCYGAAHELAHALALRNGKGWDHTEDLWSVQADLLARWVKRLAHERGDF
jgi:hypothetical protein